MLADSEIMRIIESGELKVNNLPENWKSSIQPNAYEPTIESILSSSGREVRAANGFYELDRKQHYRILHREELFSDTPFNAWFCPRSSIQRRGIMALELMYPVGNIPEKPELSIVPFFNTRIPEGESLFQIAFPSDAPFYTMDEAVKSNLITVSPPSYSSATILLHADKSAVLKAKTTEEWMELGRKYSPDEIRIFFSQSKLSEAENGDFYLAGTEEHVELSHNAVALLSGGLFSPSGVFFGTTSRGIIDSGFKGKLTLGFHVLAPLMDGIKDGSPVGFLAVSGVEGKVIRGYGANNPYQGSAGIVL